VFGSCRGAFAEYACTSESAVVIKPDSVTFEQAASAPVATFTALQGLRDMGKIQPGQKVLINGASGGVGTFAVQIAKWFGANVTAVLVPQRHHGVDLARRFTLHLMCTTRTFDERLLFAWVASYHLSA